MKFNIYIDGVLLRTPDGSTELEPRDILIMDKVSAGEEMLIMDDIAMIERSGIKASIHLANQAKHFHDLSNRSIKVEKMEEEK